MTTVVAKVGGSLFDLPDLRERLRTWVVGTGRPVLLVPGGGDGADVIRRLDQTHRLGDEAAHWLALGVLAVNARFLGGLLGAPVVAAPTDLTGVINVLNALAFCQADDGRPGSLPRGWHVTSDAIAARVAEVLGAELVLLKSTDLPAGISWARAAADGLVDPMLDTVARRAPLRVEWVNLRSPAPCRR